MSNIFGSITLVVLLLAGFVAFRNKQRYELEISNTATEKSRLETSQKRLKKAQDDTKRTIATRQGVEQDISKLTVEVADREKRKADLESQIAAKTSEKEANQAKLDDVEQKIAQVGGGDIGGLRNLAEKMKALNTELEELAQGIAAKEASLANRIAENKSTESRIASMKTMFDTMSMGKSLPTLNTRIRSIYPNWGFVTLTAGNAAGVVADSLLDVERDGSVIARLVVTNVERNGASASIIPDSLAADTTLMVGDRVVPSKNSKTPAN